MLLCLYRHQFSRLRVKASDVQMFHVTNRTSAIASPHEKTSICARLNQDLCKLNSYFTVLLYGIIRNRHGQYIVLYRFACCCDWTSQSIPVDIVCCKFIYCRYFNAQIPTLRQLTNAGCVNPLLELQRSRRRIFQSFHRKSETNVYIQNIVKPKNNLAFCGNLKINIPNY